MAPDTDPAGTPGEAARLADDPGFVMSEFRATLAMARERGRAVVLDQGLARAIVARVSDLIDRLAATEAELEAARVAVAEAGIVLEALWYAEHDGTALAPTTKAAIRDAITKVRAALGGGARQPDVPTFDTERPAG